MALGEPTGKPEPGTPQKNETAPTGQTEPQPETVSPQTATAAAIAVEKGDSTAVLEALTDGNNRLREKRKHEITDEFNSGMHDVQRVIALLREVKAVRDGGGGPGFTAQEAAVLLISMQDLSRSKVREAIRDAQSTPELTAIYMALSAARDVFPQQYFPEVGTAISARLTELPKSRVQQEVDDAIKAGNRAALIDLNTRLRQQSDQTPPAIKKELLARISQALS